MSRLPGTLFDKSAPSDAIVEASLDGSVQTPFWIDDAPGRTTHPSLTGRAAADLAIVGGGYLGLWAALLAKERDPLRNVILLEANTVGWAASGRNGGFCEASLTHGHTNGQRRWPGEIDTLDALGQRNLDEMEQTLQRYGMDCDFERTGVLTVALEPYQVELLKGPGFLNQAEVRALVKSPTFLAGHWDRDGTAMLHPGKLVVELARVAASLGVQIHEGSPVSALRARGRRIELPCASGQVQADQVILATNAFPSLLKRYRLHTTPVYDYVLMTEPLTGSQLAQVGWQHRQGIADMGSQFHYYRITRDNRILFGGYDAIYHFGGKLNPSYEDRPETYRKLASHFFTILPQLEGLRFTHRWAGVIDTSTRFCSFFGQGLGGRVHYSAGFTGLGVAATRFSANVLLDKVERKHTERTSLRLVNELPVPFPPEPLRYAAIQAARWALDRADRNEGRRNFLLRAMDACGFGFDS